MLTALEVLPLLLYVGIALELHVTLGFLITVGYVTGNKVGENDGVDTLALVLGLNSHEQEVDHVAVATDSSKEGKSLPRLFRRAFDTDGIDMPRAMSLPSASTTSEISSRRSMPR